MKTSKKGRHIFSIKLIALTLAMILMCSFFVTGCDDESETVTIEGKPVVTLKVKDYGTITMELYPDVAPITVANFIGLVEMGFYDGLIFHRVIEDFMIQGGDPRGDGTGGSGKNIKGEFKVNGVENNLSHNRGVVSMARNGYDYDSASSQFFICHKDCSDSLDGQYAAFGIVTDGMDVVDKIAAVSTDSNDKPKKDVVIESMTVDASTYTKK
ncbi:MAG: peptidylprolyl isomerase [Clostridia bacterium]|nr:peptidylprolyl isomerase [Clostridia bacterium]